MDEIQFLFTFVAYDRTSKRTYRVLDCMYSRFALLLGRLIIQKLLYVNIGRHLHYCRDISHAKHRKDFVLCSHLNDCALFMPFFEAQRRISKPTKNIVVIVITKAIGICSSAASSDDEGTSYIDLSQNISARKEIYC